MIYIIRDITKNILGREKVTVIKVCLNEDSVAVYLANEKNIENFKGDIDVKRIVL